MKQLREAAARERRFPIFWWLFLMVLTGGMFVAAIHDQAPHAAWLVAVLLAAAWAAPLVAFHSLIPPRRPSDPIPAPGEGSFDQWLRQARKIGQALIYYDENPELSSELRLKIHIARHDLRDTLDAHPLRDDLERVCRRLWDGAIEEMKQWLWRHNHQVVREIVSQYRQDLDRAVDEDDRLVALQMAVENAAATMSRCCMPRMLERERLICARDCAWLAAQTTHANGRHVSPVELAAALVVEWSDFSEPWQPARMLHRAAERLKLSSREISAVGAETPEPIVNGDGQKPRRVRVRVRRKRRYHDYRGPSILQILLSFGQWVRYSIRTWRLYR